MENDKNRGFVCVNCGAPVKQLYQIYGSGIIKIEHCSECQKVADKYIEYEPVLVYLDIFLLKSSAFRHILKNTDVRWHWKVTALFLFCDAFANLLNAEGPKEANSLPYYVIYSAMEWGLYKNYLEAAIELAVLSCVVCIGTLMFVPNKTLNHSLSNVLVAVVLANFGKVIILPGILWSNSYNQVFALFTRIFVCAANIKALKVLYPEFPPKLCTFVVMVGHMISYLVPFFVRNIV